jgi:hypothetical protein
METSTPTRDEPSPLRRGSRHVARPALGILGVMATVAPGLVVFALPAVDLIASNEEFFRQDFSAGRNLFVLGLILVSIGFGLWASSRSGVGRFLWTCYLLITPGWLAYTALLGWHRVAGGVLVAALIVGTAWVLNRNGRLAWVNTVELLCVVLLASSLLTTFMGIRSARADADGPTGTETPVLTQPVDSSTDLPNIYHVVMDEYQTQMFETTLDDDLRQTLSGFTYFPDARTTYGRTEMSMASILGPSDYTYETTPQEFVESSLRGSRSSLQKLRQAGYRITGFSHLQSLYGSPSPFDEEILFKDYVEFDPGDDYTRLATSLWVFAYMPGGLAKRLLPSNHYAQLTGQNLLPSDAPPVSALSFKTIINRERDLTSTGRYSLVHLILPHFPYVMSPDCEYEEGIESAPADQASCATSLIRDFVEELRDLNRFESSLIVIHGDHGARFDVTGEGLVELPDDVFSEEWSDARSRPLLLIKPAGVDSSNPLAVSTYPALLTDIMPTAFDSIDVAVDANDGRVSLLAADLPARPTRFYHFYNKGDDGLPDGELTRYVMEADGIRQERSIRLPTG